MLKRNEIAWLNVASQKGETITSSPLDSEMTPNFLTERHTFVWNVKLDKKIFTWGIKMADQEAFYEFQTHFASAMHEATVKDKFKKISVSPLRIVLLGVPNILTSE